MIPMNIDYKNVSDIIKNSLRAIAFTGAGISAGSGIPTFRDSNGIFSKFDPKFFEIKYYLENVAESWSAIKEVFYNDSSTKKPSVAHVALAQMENTGLIKYVVTQNIDGLHKSAGSKNVFELHGTMSEMICMNCKKLFPLTNEKILKSQVPLCEKCDGILKPNFTFFGEALPEYDFNMAISVAEKSDLCLIIGTTGSVMPAAQIPYIAKQNGAKIIEINPKKSNYTENIVDIYIQEKADDAMKEIYENL